MYYVNKIFGFFVNPVVVALVLMCAGWIIGKKWRFGGRICGFAAFAGLWFVSTPLCMVLLGLPLEAPYLATEAAETLPQADAIVVLGGGMLYAKDFRYPDMNDAADRVWHAARLYKAGKAPLVVLSGTKELEAAAPLLRDLGVPEEAILVDNESRNTFENARFTENLLKNRSLEHPSILLVTSAWHETRALGNFSRIDAETIPAATDFRVSTYANELEWWKYPLPDAGMAGMNAMLVKEWVGRLARK